MDYAVVMAAPDIYHHGIKGQKWGVRRFQNKDGSLTAAGKKRYDDDGPDDRRPNKSGQRETSVKFAEARMEDGKKVVSSMMTDTERYLYTHRNTIEKGILAYGATIFTALLAGWGYMGYNVITGKW